MSGMRSRLRWPHSGDSALGRGLSFSGTPREGLADTGHGGPAALAGVSGPSLRPTSRAKGDSPSRPARRSFRPFPPARASTRRASPALPKVRPAVFQELKVGQLLLERLARGF